MHDPVLVRLMDLYRSFDPQILSSLGSIYSQAIIFRDPVQQVVGLEQLRNYFAHMMNGLDECRFDFSDVITDRGNDAECRAALIWTMRYRHPKLEGGRLLTLQGTSHVKYLEQITYHRDYFDMGAMVYEHIPLMRTAVSHIKKRLEY